MNLFGDTESDGNGRLVRQVALGASVVVFAALVATLFLDEAAKDGSLASLSGGSLNPGRHMATIPRSSTPAGGVRYGNVDYMPTASIPAGRQKIKNVVSDPSLGMPD